MPARQAVLDGVVREGFSVLDYGCGRGHDVNHLRSMGVDAAGWDPAFNPATSLSPRDAVLLTYVLNVIEDPEERVRTLRAAWELSSEILIASARLTWESRRVRGTEMEDGLLTSRGTFQHLFRPEELRSLVGEVTTARCISAAPGVVYAFKSEELRLRYLASKYLPEFDWEYAEEYTELVDIVKAFAEARGRLPVLEEMPVSMVSRVGTVNWTALVKTVNKATSPDVIEAAAKRSTLNVLLFLGMEIFSGRSKLADLPLSVRIDIRRFFRSYQEACRRADRLLLKLRDHSYVRGAMRNSVGKLTPSALYVHKRAVPALPVVLRLYEHCGAIAAGRPEHYDLVKLHHDRHAVSWLEYPDFDEDPHPRLHSSYLIDLPELTTHQEDYTGRSNRPLLHRKEEFLSPDDSLFGKFQRLTAAERKAGLYSNPSSIGTEDGWRRVLEERGVELRGHRLVKRQWPVP